MAVSALQSLQLLERHYSHEAVAPPAFDDPVMLWAGTSLGIAGVPLLVGEGELEEIVEMPVTTQVPGTKPWVIGVGAHRGVLLPIISGDVLFRKVPYSGRVREYCMVVRRSGFYFGITLSDIERSLKFPIEQRDMDHPVDPDFNEFCLGGFPHGDKFLAVLDIDKLVADPDFANASAVEADSTEGLER
jgi:twitching motility protein PilI